LSYRVIHKINKSIIAVINNLDDIDIESIIKNNNGVLDDYDVEEFTPFEPTIEEQKQSIINQLSKLDIIVPRVVEDILEQSKFTVHESKQAIINQKVALRAQLRELGAPNA
jgi:hypothetical protein